MQVVAPIVDPTSPEFLLWRCMLVIDVLPDPTHDSLRRSLRAHFHMPEPDANLESTRSHGAVSLDRARLDALTKAVNRLADALTRDRHAF